MWRPDLWRLKSNSLWSLPSKPVGSPAPASKAPGAGGGQAFMVQCPGSGLHSAFAHCRPLGQARSWFPISGGGAPLYRGRGTPGHAQDVTAWVWGHSGDSGSLGGEGTESAGLVRVRASKCGWRTCWKGLPGTATTSKNPDREPAAAGARAAQPWHLWHSPPSEGSRPRGGQPLAAPV